MDQGYKEKLDATHELIRSVIENTITDRKSFSDVQLPMLLVALGDILDEVRTLRHELSELRSNAEQFNHLGRSK